MPIEALLVFRLAATATTALVLSYAMALPLPYLGPLLALFLAASAKPAIPPKGLALLLVLVALTLGAGLWMGVALQHYPATAFLLIALGLYLANALALVRGQALLGTLLTVGLTMIAAASQASTQLGMLVIEAFAFGVLIAVASQWLVYPLFPSTALQVPEKPSPPVDARWLALRTTVVLLPAFTAVLINPAVYMPLILKSAQLAQSDSGASLRRSSRELLGSTLLAGALAMIFWLALTLAPTLWFFALWFAIAVLALGGRMLGAVASRRPPTFWQNALVTMVILLGPAVQDSASGKDVYQAFALRFALFIVVTLYAGAAVHFLDGLRGWLRGGAFQRETYS